MSAISSPEFQAKVTTVRRNRRLLSAEEIKKLAGEPTVVETTKGIADLARILELGVEIAESATSAGAEKNLNLFGDVTNKRFRFIGTERTRIGFRTNGWLLEDPNPAFPATNGQWFNHGSVAFGRSLAADGALFRHNVPDSMSDECGLIAYQVEEVTYAGVSGEQQELALHREITRMEASLAEFVVRTHLL